MNMKNFTIKSQEAIQRAQQIAMENKHQAIEPAHILKGILEIDKNVTPFVFKKIGVNFNVVKQTVDSIVNSLPKVSGGEQYLSKNGNEVLQKYQEGMSAEDLVGYMTSKGVSLQDTKEIIKNAVSKDQKAFEKTNDSKRNKGILIAIIVAAIYMSVRLWMRTRS